MRLSDYLKRSLLLVALLAALILGALTGGVQMTTAAAAHTHTPTVAPYCPPPPRICAPSF